MAHNEINTAILFGILILILEGFLSIFPTCIINNVDVNYSKGQICFSIYPSDYSKIKNAVNQCIINVNFEQTDLNTQPIHE